MQLADLETITIETSLLIGILLIVRKVLGDRIHPLVAKSLWGFVVFRVLFPVEICCGQLWGMDFPRLFFDDNTYLRQVLKGIWIAGVVICLVVFIGRNLVFAFVLRKSRELYGKKDGLLIYFVDYKIGSCLVGLLFPRIYISRLAEDSFDWCSWIVRHELCHYYARDNWYSFLRSVCIAFQWFNPLVWYGVQCSVEDFELACDYEVTKKEDIENQLTYGKCLVAMSAKNPRNYLQSVVNGTSLSRGSLKRRLQRIGNRHSYSKRIGVGVFLLLFLATGMCFLGEDNGKASLWYELAQLPYINENVVCYEVEQPTEETVQQVMESMQFRINELSEEVSIVRLDDAIIGVVFPVKGEYYSLGKDETADYIAYGGEVVIVADGKRYPMDVTENLLTQEWEENRGYSLWLSVFAKDLQEQQGEYYYVYLGEHLLYAGEKQDITTSGICILKNVSFDRMYDVKKVLLTENMRKVARR